MANNVNAVKVHVQGTVDKKAFATIIHHFRGLSYSLDKPIELIVQEYAMLLIKYGAMPVTLYSHADRILDEAFPTQITTTSTTPKRKARRNH